MLKCLIGVTISLIIRNRCELSLTENWGDVHGGQCKDFKLQCTFDA